MDVRDEGRIGSMAISTHLFEQFLRLSVLSLVLISNFGFGWI